VLLPFPLFILAWYLTDWVTALATVFLLVKEQGEPSTVELWFMLAGCLLCKFELGFLSTEVSCKCTLLCAISHK
jgi:hypothetical protein